MAKCHGRIHKLAAEGGARQALQRSQQWRSPANFNTGDAAYIASINVKQQVPFGYYINLEDVMAGLRRIACEGKHVLPTHDAEVYKLYPEGIR
jgi:hypothetical protein